MNDTPDHVLVSAIPIEPRNGPFESREYRIYLQLTHVHRVTAEELRRLGEPAIREYIDPQLRESLNHRIYGQIREIARNAVYGTEGEMRDALDKLANYRP